MKFARTCKIDINFLQYHRVRREQFYDKPSVAALLLDSGLVQSTVETLAVRGKPPINVGFACTSELTSHDLFQFIDRTHLRTHLVGLGYSPWCSSCNSPTTTSLALPCS